MKVRRAFVIGSKGVRQLDTKCTCWTDSGVPPITWICETCKSKIALNARFGKHSARSRGE